MSDSLDPGVFSLPQAVILAFLSFAGMVITGLLSFFGGRGSVQAQLQGQLNETMKLVVARLEAELETLRAEHLDLKGRASALEQYNVSLARILRDANIEVPPPPKTEPVFVLAPPPHVKDAE